MDFHLSAPNGVTEIRNMFSNHPHIPIHCIADSALCQEGHLCEAVKSRVRYHTSWRSCLLEILARFVYRFFPVITGDYRHPYIFN